MPIVTSAEFLATNFDYLVVGGGTAGLVVAARLVENTDLTVGVLEAGEYHATDPEVNVPGMMARGIFNPKFDWAFFTPPQKYVNNRALLQSRGKGLGGSSLLNLLAAVRPSKEELNALEELGNPGWNWDSLLHYMKKSERLDIPNISAAEAKAYAVVPDPKYHGTNGPIVTSFPPHVTELHTNLLDSLEKLGIPRNPDNGGGRPVGALLVPATVDSKTATRSYSVTGYFIPNAKKPNLVILTGAYTTKIHLKATADGLQRAVGVAFIKDGVSQTVTASKEIIMAAGPFQTPQLLELSGIGDKRILGPLGVECVIDLPGVGENLQDHAVTPTIVEVDKKIETLEVLRNPAGLEKHEQLYAQQKGILANIPSSLFTFFPGRAFGTDEDLQRWKGLANIAGSPAEIFANTDPSVLRGIEKQYSLMSRWIADPTQPIAQLMNLNGHFPIPGMNIDAAKRYATLLIVYSHPFSRGTVHAVSTDATVPPQIQQNYLSNPADVEILAKGLAFMHRLYDTPPVSSLVVSKVAPPAELTDHEGLKEFVRNTLGTSHHPVGTAAMLPREDGGVVSSKLLVYGTTNLRVVDSSVIPLEPSSNIQTVVYAFAEKAADIILEGAK